MFANYIQVQPTHTHALPPSCFAIDRLWLYAIDRLVIGYYIRAKEYDSFEQWWLVDSLLWLRSWFGLGIGFGFGLGITLDKISVRVLRLRKMT
jgi:hypothetical protein